MRKVFVEYSDTAMLVYVNNRITVTLPLPEDVNAPATVGDIQEAVHNAVQAISDALN